MTQNLNQSNSQLNQIFQQYKHFQDTRTPFEVEITQRLLNILSQANFKRISSQNTSVIKKTTIKKEDIIYVCLNGLPFFPNQFTTLNLPGQLLEHKYTPFEQQLTIQQIKAFPCTFEEQADILHKKINAISTTKPLVFIYHSFGTFIMSTYMKLYQSSRIIGMIDLVGTPFRMHSFLKVFAPIIGNRNIQQIQDNLPQLFEEHKIKLIEAKQFYFPTPQLLFAYCRALKEGNLVFSIYDIQKEWPNVLKCFINGNKDTILSENDKLQKIAYYTFNKKFDKAYEQRLKKVWLKRYGYAIDNVQQKFIFIIEGGAHSIHLQKKHKSKLQAIIHNYLEFIQLIYQIEEPKL